MLPPLIYLNRVRDWAIATRDEQPAHSKAVEVLTEMIEMIDRELLEIVTENPLPEIEKPDVLENLLWAHRCFTGAGTMAVES